MSAAAVFPLLLLVLPLLGQSASAAPICRWVDDSGRTHLADVVPERYAATAQCSDSSQYRIDPDRVIKAQQEAQLMRQRAGLGDQRAVDPAQSAASGAGSGRPPAASPTTQRRPSRGVDDSTDCATWRQLYRESGECFGPYRTVGGGVKAEAFDKCRPIPSPELKCGPGGAN
ncbi:hypothetical protein [Piscinibacter sakaiensis]|uniref:hypothetical protein n=1 Tax=Piscinibacter sakaiensis TaxID=1547922 RepID=UPI003AAE19EF